MEGEILHSITTRCKVSESAKSLKQWQDEVHETARDKGWHNGENTVWKMLGNIHAEVSEAWEEARRPEFDPTAIRLRDKDGKPEGFPTELADIVIRCFDTAGALGIDLEAVMETKAAFNKTRPHRHGDKRA
jgi:NTP pyrophosphatase (non-canonical NTP hydrolase)